MGLRILTLDGQSQQYLPLRSPSNFMLSMARLPPPFDGGGFGWGCYEKQRDHRPLQIALFRNPSMFPPLLTAPHHGEWGISVSMRKVSLPRRCELQYTVGPRLLKWGASRCANRRAMTFRKESSSDRLTKDDFIPSPNCRPSLVYNTEIRREAPNSGHEVKVRAYYSRRIPFPSRFCPSWFRRWTWRSMSGSLRIVAGRQPRS
jgi:hypothetical protein